MTDSDFPCALTISLPLPSYRLASSALRALQVDAELSPLVRRSFSLAVPDGPPVNAGVNLKANGASNSATHMNGDAAHTEAKQQDERLTVLRTEYKATTNRMLRVAVNGFMESLGVVLGVMEELDVDVLAKGMRTV